MPCFCFHKEHGEKECFGYSPKFWVRYWQGQRSMHQSDPADTQRWDIGDWKGKNDIVTFLDEKNSPCKRIIRINANVTHAHPEISVCQCVKIRWSPINVIKKFEICVIYCLQTTWKYKYLLNQKGLPVGVGRWGVILFYGIIYWQLSENLQQLVWHTTARLNLKADVPVEIQ